jgi:hypothetical protein
VPAEPEPEPEPEPTDPATARMFKIDSVDRF